jgi:hypothetical protein
MIEPVRVSGVGKRSAVTDRHSQTTITGAATTLSTATDDKGVAA